jgi:lipid-A-disaccharide synthase
MLVIFPFETEVYKDTTLETVFVGHPLVEVVEGRRDKSITRDKNRFLLLPGSRSNEINRLFVPMLETAAALYAKNPNLKFAAAAPRETVYLKLKQIYDNFVSTNRDLTLPDIDITHGDTEKWMQEASTGLAASGTVTVECAIAGLPLTVVYKLNPITYLIARILIKLPFFTMVNLIAGKKVFDEFLQGDVNKVTLTESIEKILPGGIRRQEIEKDISDVVHSLSAGKEAPSRKVAEEVLKCINEN